MYELISKVYIQKVFKVLKRSLQPQTKIIARLVNDIITVLGEIKCNWGKLENTRFLKRKYLLALLSLKIFPARTNLRKQVLFLNESGCLLTLELLLSLQNRKGRNLGKNKDEDGWHLIINFNFILNKGNTDDNAEDEEHFFPCNSYVF